MTARTIVSIARFIVVLVLCAAGVTRAAAADAPAAATAREWAPVVIANRTIISLSGPIAGYSARERAAASIERIERVLNDDKQAAVTTQPAADGTQVLVGGKPAFLVTGADIDPQIGETTENVAREAARRLQNSIAEYREQRTPRYILAAIAWIVLATVLVVALVRLIFFVDRRLGAWLSQLSAARAQALHVSGVSVFDPAHVQLITRRILKIVAWLLALLAVYGWLTFSLTRIPYTRPWGEHMEGKLLAILLDAALASVAAMPGLVVAVLILLIARAMTRLASVFFERIEQGRITVGGLDRDTALPTRRIANVVIWLFALALAYPYLPGAQTEAFKGLSVLVGLMVSIGASGIVGQAASGLILMYTRTLRAGEFVRIGDTEGNVTTIGLFTTRIRTGLGEEVLMPNSLILQNATRNYSRAVPGRGCIVDTVVTIGYSTPWRQVQAMLLEAARRVADIATDPPPFVRQTALSDFYVEYRLIALTTAESALQRADVLNRLHAAIQDVFNEHDVQIMSPHYMADPAEPQVVPKARWYEAPAQLPDAAAPRGDSKR
jgi:small-conductance mechanosensitive channel